MNTGDKLGRYKLGDKIGEGAMSAVFASRHPLLERDVAIKVLKKEVCSDQQYVARFLDDARAAHGLNHPNVVRVLDVDDTHEQPFIVMDLVRGQPLDEWRKGQVDLPVAVQIMRDVASALAAAHAGGLVHRDVKPSNVLIEKSTGRAKLTDFGAAKREREGGQELTQMGQRIGTPRYMAPEQVEGNPVSKCTDLFALGALGYELLAGKPAFEGGSINAVFTNILLRQPQPLPELRDDVPQSLVDLIDRLLQKKAEDRPASAEEVVAALDQLDHAAPPSDTIAASTAAAPEITGMGGDGRTGGQSATGASMTGTEASPAGVEPAAGRARSGPPMVPIAAGIAVLLVLLGGGYWLFSGPDEPTEPVVAEDQAAAPDEETGDVAPPVEEAEVEPPVEAPSEEAPSEEAAAGQDMPSLAERPAAEPEAPEPPEQPGTTAEPQVPAADDQPADPPSLATALRDQPSRPAAGAPDTGEAEPADAGVAPEPPEEPVGPEGAAEVDRTEDAEPPAAATAEAEPPSEPAPAPPEDTAAGRDQTGGTETPSADREEQELETAQLPVAEPPELPAADDAGEDSLGLNCAADEPGCAFAETVAEAVEPVEGGRPEIILNKEDGIYFDQEYLVVEVAMPTDLGGHLYLDVYTDNGEVFHLLPEPLRQSNDLGQGDMIRVGVEADERKTGVRHWQISGPFGTGWLIALVTENRLFDDLRPIGETIEAYRPELLDALDDPTLGRVSYSMVPVEFKPR